MKAREMASVLGGKKVVLGVCGGIAAFKSVILCRELLRRGAEVRVAMTPSATHFVGPLSFAAITGKPAATDLLDPHYPGEVHVELGTWADAMIIAPATMHALGRLAYGMADDIVIATAVCQRGPLLLAPAMHHRMWDQAATQSNVAILVRRGVTLVGPVKGALASGDFGDGRMEEPESIADTLETMLHPGDLTGLRILVTAGPTYEDLDPVRFLGNRSSGKMGYRLAERARARGAEVTLVSGPVSQEPPPGVTTLRVRSALEMEASILASLPEADVVIMAAAVADFRPASRAAHKLKKTNAPSELALVRNPDILAGLGARRVGSRPILVGFAVESEALIERARKKLTDKSVDMVVANHASVGFEGDQNEASLVTAEEVDELPRMSKAALADRILDRIVSLAPSLAPGQPSLVPGQAGDA